MITDSVMLDIKNNATRAGEGLPYWITQIGSLDVDQITHVLSKYLADSREQARNWAMQGKTNVACITYATLLKRHAAVVSLIYVFRPLFSCIAADQVFFSSDSSVPVGHHLAGKKSICMYTIYT